MRHLTAALLIATLAACSSTTSSDVSAGPQTSQTVSQQELGKAFTMKIGDAITLNDLRLTFRSVDADSRCPTDVVCVWAGDGEVALKIDQNGKSAVAALHTTLDPKKTEWNGYTISLVSLSPSRRSDTAVKSEDYRAEILVTR